MSFEGGEVEAHTWLTPDRRAPGHGGRVIGDVAADELDAATARACSVDRRDARPPGARTARRDRGRRTSRPRSPGSSCRPVAAWPASPINAYLVGHRRHRADRPGRPDRPRPGRAINLATARGGTIDAICLTQVDPGHAGGAEALAEVLGIPVLGGPGAGRLVPYAVSELADLETIAHSDVTVTAVHTPGHDRITWPS